MPEDFDKKFPAGFLWGASTSAHQVEGGTHNQWSVWELSNASNLAKTAQSRLNYLPNWKSIKTQAETPSNYVSGRGVDHFSRYEEDFNLLKELNLNSFRFGVEWSRLEPKEGEWDENAIEHYRSYINSLTQRGIEPILNIWHWTVPVWFAEKGGFKKAANLQYFYRFVEKIAHEYGKSLNYVITLNEPNVYASFSYITGEWPPEEKSLWNGSLVYWRLAKAHKRAYEILKKANPMLEVGIATQLANIQAKRPHNVFDGLSTKCMRYIWNWWFLRRIRDYQDFIGVNYYFTDYYTGLFKRKNPKVPVSDMGWYMEPEGLYPLLLRIWTRFKKPIIVSETGLADEQDEYRRWWIQESVIAMQRAMSEGVDIRGYLYWSLLDNFEWKYGWWPKFGLVSVDRENGMKRQIRDSAKWFAGVIARLSK